MSTDPAFQLGNSIGYGFWAIAAILVVVALVRWATGKTFGAFLGWAAGLFVGGGLVGLIVAQTLKFGFFGGMGGIIGGIIFLLLFLGFIGWLFNAS